MNYIECWSDLAFPVQHAPCLMPTLSLYHSWLKSIKPTSNSSRKLSSGFHILLSFMESKSCWKEDRSLGWFGALRGSEKKNTDMLWLTSAQNIWNFFRGNFWKVSWSLLEHCSTAKSLSCTLSAKRALFPVFTHFILDSWLRERKEKRLNHYIFSKEERWQYCLAASQNLCSQCQPENRREEAHRH